MICQACVLLKATVEIGKSCRLDVEGTIHKRARWAWLVVWFVIIECEGAAAATYRNGGTVL